MLQMLGRLERSSNRLNVSLGKQAKCCERSRVREVELIWHNEREGYGFVKIGDAEVFCTGTWQFGLIGLLTGDKVSASLTTNEHGQVIQDLLTVNRPVSPAPPAATET